VLVCLSLHVLVCGSRGHFCTDPSASLGRILLWHAKHTILHTDHCCCWQLVNSSRPSFSIKEENRIPRFLTPCMLSYLAISATLGCIQRSWTPGQMKSDHPLLPPTPSCCSLRWGIALPSWDTPLALYQPRWTLSRSHMASVSYTANFLYLLLKTLPVFSFCRCWNPAASRW